MLESSIQQRFFNVVAHREKMPEGTAHGIITYRNLVFHRYEEVIHNAFPLMTEQAGKEWINGKIFAFQRTKITSTFIWMLPHEFYEFLKASNAFAELPHMPWASELAWYEWLEIELFMGNYDFSKEEKFSYDRNYQFSPSARLQVFSYPVFRGEFSQEQKGEYHVVTFYNFENHRISYREITPFLYQLLSSLPGEVTLGHAVDEIAGKEGIDPAEARDILAEVLADFAQSRIIH